MLIVNKRRIGFAPKRILLYAQQIVVMEFESLPLKCAMMEINLIIKDVNQIAQVLSMDGLAQMDPLRVQISASPFAETEKICLQKYVMMGQMTILDV